MARGWQQRTMQVRRGFVAIGLALTTTLSTVVLAPAAGATDRLSATRVAAELHVISYQGNGGVGEAPTAQRVLDGASTTVAANTFVREQFEFVEWNTRSDLTGTAYRPGASISPTADVTLYAKWDFTTEVQLFTSSPSQVYRTTDPQTIGVFVGGSGFGWAPGDDEELPSPGKIQIRNHGTVIRTVPADPFGFTELPIPTDLPLGRAEFTATFVPAAGGKTITSDPVRFTIARASTVTRVMLRQQTLSAADRKKFKVRSAMSVSVHVAGVGTRTAAPGTVAVTVGGKVLTLKLVDGSAKTVLIPTAAGKRTVVASYQPGLDWWVRSTGRASITVRRPG